MTSIVKDTPSNTFFESFERFEIAHRNGALVGDEFSKIQISLGSIFSNLVKRGLKTEEEAEDFLSQIPNGKWPCYNFSHKNQELAYNTIKQDINAALYEMENLSKQTKQIKRI